MTTSSMLRRIENVEKKLKQQQYVVDIVELRDALELAGFEPNATPRDRPTFLSCGPWRVRITGEVYCNNVESQDEWEIADVIRKFAPRLTRTGGRVGGGA